MKRATMAEFARRCHTMLLSFLAIGLVGILGVRISVGESGPFPAKAAGESEGDTSGIELRFLEKAIEGEEALEILLNLHAGEQGVARHLLRRKLLEGIIAAYSYSGLDVQSEEDKRVIHKLVTPMVDYVWQHSDSMLNDSRLRAHLAAALDAATIVLKGDRAYSDRLSLLTTELKRTQRAGRARDHVRLRSSGEIEEEGPDNAIAWKVELCLNTASGYSFHIEISDRGEVSGRASGIVVGGRPPDKRDNRTSPAKLQRLEINLSPAERERVLAIAEATIRKHKPGKKGPILQHEVIYRSPRYVCDAWVRVVHGDSSITLTKDLIEDLNTEEELLALLKTVCDKAGGLYSKALASALEGRSGKLRPLYEKLNEQGRRPPAGTVPQKPEGRGVRVPERVQR